MAKNIVSCSPKSSLEKSKRGRKRGRPTAKQSTLTSKKRKGLNPKYMGNWIIRPKPRRDGSRVDVYYIHKTEPDLICRSIKEVERYENDGTRPDQKVNKEGKRKSKRKITYRG
ncbi:hypothetical protein P8452_20135 [Trifolium repens]|nr:hypothetical protein P8452_20135 [Trifolium repens]